MSRCRLRILVPVTLLFAALSCGAAHLSPWDEWRLGYTNFEIGEQTRTRGDYTASLEAFEKSKRHYLAVKKARPDWNQKVIRERLEACDKQIAELRRLLGDKAPPARTAEKGGGGAAPVERGGASSGGARQANPAEEQLRRTRRELAEATTELEELRRERAKRRNYETEIANLIRDQRIAREKYALLEKSYRKLQEELKKPDSSLQELRKQLMEKHDRLVDAEKSIRLLEERLRHEEQNAVVANREKIQLRKQLQRLEEARQRLQGEVDGIRAELTSTQERGRKAEVRAADLEKSLHVAEARAADLEKSLRESEANRSTASQKASADADASSEELARLRVFADAAEKRTRQFQQQCVELRRECDEMLKKLQAAEQSRSRGEEIVAQLRSEAEKERTRAESLADELAKVREIQRRQEEELTKVLAEIEPLKARLARRDSDDFKGMVAAQSALRKLEEDLTTLKNRDAESAVVIAEEKKLTAALRQKLEDVKKALLQARGRLKSCEQELEAARGEAEKYRELAPRYQELERNFAALHRENQENRIKLAAASPREAELQRIKLRLVELDQLKSSLGREQRLTAELAADKKRLQEELADLRKLGTELAAARKQLENLKALQREVHELRRVNRDTVARLETMKKLEDELVTAKKSLIESGAAQLELHEVKIAYAKVLGERNAAATEAARLRDALSESESREKQTRKILTEAVNETSRLRGELAKMESQEKHTREASAAAENEASRLRDELSKLEQREKRAGEASAAAESGLAQTLEKTRQQLREAQDRVEKLEALLPQLEQLRKLNDELMRARSFEAELIKARAALGELTRYKDELAGVTKLNEQLAREKAELEKELARRPRLPFQDQQEEHLKLVRAATREKPEDYVAEGILAESSDSIELAIWNYRKALWLKPAHGEASARLGLLLLKRGDYEESARLLAAARAAAPDRLDLALAISRAYLGQKRFGNAQAVLEPLLKRYPENGELLTVAAMAAAEGGDAAKAEKYLKLAIRFLPNSPEPRIEFARLLIHQDAARLDEASSLYEKARLMGAKPDIELEPILGPRLDKRREMESFLHSAMNEAFDSKDYSGAAWYCKQLLELNRRPAYFTPLLALARLQGGESGGARETLTFNSESAQGALVLALVELKDGDRQAFSAAVRRALALNHGRPVVIDTEWRNLGFALDAAKAADGAAGAELATAYRWEAAR